MDRDLTIAVPPSTMIAFIEEGSEDMARVWRGIALLRFGLVRWWTVTSRRRDGDASVMDLFSGYCRRI